MIFNWALLLCAGICYFLYNALISIRLKTTLTGLGYKIRYKFVFLAHMAGKLHNHLFSIKSNYSVTVMTALSNKDIPLPIGAIATNTYYKTKYIISLSIIAWVCRIAEWFCVLIFSIMIMATTIYKAPSPPFIFSSTLSAICIIFAFELLTILIILFIEYIINLSGLKTFKSLYKSTSQETLFEYYNTIDGDSDEKAYNSDICVQRYFQRRKTRTIKDLLKASDRDVILDVGCGSGIQLQTLDLIAPKLLIGTDLSLNALIYAKNKNIPGSEFVRCDAQQLPFKNQTVDKIICAELIEHLPDPTRMINEVQRVLNNNGSIVITTPNEISIWGFYEFLWDVFGRGRNYGETHLRFFSVDDLNTYFKSFRTRYATTLFFLSPLIALLNNRSLVQWGKHFDSFFERTNNGVSIVYYAKK